MNAKLLNEFAQHIVTEVAYDESRTVVIDAVIAVARKTNKKWTPEKSKNFRKKVWELYYSSNK